MIADMKTEIAISYTVFGEVCVQCMNMEQTIDLHINTSSRHPQTKTRK